MFKSLSPLILLFGLSVSLYGQTSEPPTLESYQQVFASADKLVFTKDLYVFKNATGVAGPAFEDEGEQETLGFLTTIFCDLELKKAATFEGKMPLSDTVHEVKDLEIRGGANSSYRQHGVNIKFSAESTKDNLVKIVCVKQSHVDWPPLSSPYLQPEELALLLAEFTKKVEPDL